MIKIEGVYTGNWIAAIRGMRNPMNSWEKSDSYTLLDYISETEISTNGFYYKPQTIDGYIFHMGENDLKLATNLVKAGTDHSKFMRMIIFSCDITAPLYWWKEMDTYKVGTVRNSCSTMHKIMEKDFSKEDFSFEKVNFEYRRQAEDFIDGLNLIKKEYCLNKEKGEWETLIQLLPSSYNQRATWTANYGVLRNIYHSRANHKLDEWREFCNMIEQLPYSGLITG